MKLITLGIGSNHEQAASLGRLPSLLTEIGSVETCSPVYLSQPASGEGAPYWNAVIRLKMPEEINYDRLKQMLVAIEDQAERLRPPHSQAKIRVTLDLDILLMGDSVAEVGRWQVPHPDILTRAFVAVPLADIDPDGLHPVTHETYATIAARLGRAGLERVAFIWPAG